MAPRRNRRDEGLDREFRPAEGRLVRFKKWTVRRFSGHTTRLIGLITLASFGFFWLARGGIRGSVIVALNRWSNTLIHNNMSLWIMHYRRHPLEVITGLIHFNTTILRSFGGTPKWIAFAVMATVLGAHLKKARSDKQPRNWWGVVICMALAIFIGYPAQFQNTAVGADAAFRRIGGIQGVATISQSHAFGNNLSPLPATGDVVDAQIATTQSRVTDAYGTLVDRDLQKRHNSQMALVVAFMRFIFVAVVFSTIITSLALVGLLLRFVLGIIACYGIVALFIMMFWPPGLRWLHKRLSYIGAVAITGVVLVVLLAAAPLLLITPYALALSHGVAWALVANFVAVPIVFGISAAISHFLGLLKESAKFRLGDRGRLVLGSLHHVSVRFRNVWGSVCLVPLHSLVGSIRMAVTAFSVGFSSVSSLRSRETTA